MNISDIRAGLRTLVENEETTFKQIALESGLSTGTISSFINDKYNGDNERVSQILQRWLENIMQLQNYLNRPALWKRRR